MKKGIYFVSYTGSKWAKSKFARRDVFRKLSVLKNHVSRDFSGKFTDYGRRTGIFTLFRESVGDINVMHRKIFAPI